MPTQPTRSSEPVANNLEVEKRQAESQSETARSPTPEKKPISLEEENRQLREARLCKVCMDGEVSSAAILYNSASNTLPRCSAL